MQAFNSYYLVIFLSCIIILSYLYNRIAKRFNIPSVLLLIATGIIIHQLMGVLGIPEYNWFPLLEVLGIVGLIMIVLEASMDLELSRKKLPLIIKSFSIALISLVVSTLAFAFILQYFIDCDFATASLYSIPLAVISSAIVIPSVVNLDEEEREFLVYEGTFSDILGIMFFYFLLEAMEAPEGQAMAAGMALNVLITVILSFVLSYILIWIFQKLRSTTKLFLLIAVLILLYSVGKLFHLSSLVIILVFGLVLNNYKMFFAGKLRSLVSADAMKVTLENFKVVTLESAFVVRTFFFIIFGISITLGNLLSFKVFAISMLILACMFAIRFVLIKLFEKKSVQLKTLIAPRGLITVLLFYAIPPAFQIEAFDSGILLYVMLVTAVLMSYSLIQHSRKDVFEEVVKEVGGDDFSEEERPPLAERENGENAEEDKRLESDESQPPSEDSAKDDSEDNTTKKEDNNG